MNLLSHYMTHLMHIPVTSQYTESDTFVFQNGTFLGPTLSVPIMMFAGFGVTLRDMPSYLKWGTYISYLRYGLEGYVSAIYGYGREILDCVELYCHYRVPDTFLNEISMTGDQFWKDVIALLFILLFFRLLTYPLLKFKLRAVR
jgi:hypothetical protein